MVIYNCLSKTSDRCPRLGGGWRKVRTPIPKVVVPNKTTLPLSGREVRTETAKRESARTSRLTGRALQRCRGETVKSLLGARTNQKFGKQLEFLEKVVRIDR